MNETISNHGDRIRDIRTFGMKDNLEKVDGIVPVLYPASLLYFVSALLEGTDNDAIDKPIVGMQRYYADKKPFNTNQDIIKVKEFMAGKTYWSECDEGDGKASKSHKHGDFDVEGMPTMESVKHIIRNGF